MGARITDASKIQLLTIYDKIPWEPSIDAKALPTASSGVTETHHKDLPTCGEGDSCSEIMVTGRRVSV